jgi:lysozyme family protein
MPYSDKFLRAFTFSVLGWEAVYAKGHDDDPAFVISENVPNDPGGLTKFGIDQRSHPDVDIRNLTLEQAQQIFHDGRQAAITEGGEWTKINGDALPDKWSLALFDCAINPGLACILWAQELVGEKTDGIVGPLTIAALAKADDKALSVFLKKRDLYYLTRGSWAKGFEAGWRDRNDALRKELSLA